MRSGCSGRVGGCFPYGDQIGATLEQNEIVSELAGSNQVARWAYAQTEAAGGLTWVRGDEMLALGAEWRKVLRGG